MPRESHGRALLIDRCWSIYLLVIEAFAVPSSLQVEFPAVVERALLSGLFSLTVHPSGEHTLYLREEYQLTEHHLEIRSYSYVLTDRAGAPLLRADPLPHHRTDYRKRPLRSFPHHLHDNKGRIVSFTGDLKDFLTRAQQYISSSE